MYFTKDIYEFFGKCDFPYLVFVIRQKVDTPCDFNEDEVAAAIVTQFAEFVDGKGVFENIISLSMNDQLIFVFIKGLLSAGPNYRGLGTTLVRSTFTAPQENPGCLYNKI